MRVTFVTLYIPCCQHDDVINSDMSCYSNLCYAKRLEAIDNRYKSICEIDSTGEIVEYWKAVFLKSVIKEKKECLKEAVFLLDNLCKFRLDKDIYSITGIKASTPAAEMDLEQVISLVSQAFSSKEVGSQLRYADDIPEYINELQNQYTELTNTLPTLHINYSDETEKMFKVKLRTYTKSINELSKKIDTLKQSLYSECIRFSTVHLLNKELANNPKDNEMEIDHVDEVLPDVLEDIPSNVPVNQMGLRILPSCQIRNSIDPQQLSRWRTLFGDNAESVLCSLQYVKDMINQIDEQSLLAKVDSSGNLDPLHTASIPQEVSDMVNIQSATIPDNLYDSLSDCPFPSPCNSLNDTSCVIDTNIGNSSNEPVNEATPDSQATASAVELSRAVSDVLSHFNSIESILGKMVSLKEQGALDSNFDDIIENTACENEDFSTSNREYLSQLQQFQGPPLGSFSDENRLANRKFIDEHLLGNGSLVFEELLQDEDTWSDNTIALVRRIRGSIYEKLKEGISTNIDPYLFSFINLNRSCNVKRIHNVDDEVRALLDRDCTNSEILSFLANKSSRTSLYRSIRKLTLHSFPKEAICEVLSSLCKEWLFFIT